MGDALSAVLQLRSQEEQRRQNDVNVVLRHREFLQQAQQQASAQKLAQLQQAQQAGQNAQELQLKKLLTDAQVKNYESDNAAKNQQTDILKQALDGTSGLKTKSVNIGGVTLEDPTLSDLKTQREDRLIKQQQFSNSTKLRQEFINRPEVKDYMTVSPNIKAMDSLLNKGLSGDIKNMVALDQGLITMFNKLTDPQSVVRESEYARTPSNLPIVNQFQGAFQKLQAGGAGMTNDDRKALVQGAKIIANERGGQFQKTLDEYKGTAADYGLDEKLITRDMPSFTEFKTGANDIGDNKIPTFDADKEARYQAWKAKQK